MAIKIIQDSKTAPLLLLLVVVAKYIINTPARAY